MRVLASDDGTHQPVRRLGEPVQPGEVAALDDFATDCQRVLTTLVLRLSVQALSKRLEEQFGGATGGGTQFC